LIKSLHKFFRISSGNSSLRDFNKTRPSGPLKYICYAPFKNMYFNIHGDVAPCWLTFSDPDSIIDKSISEIWNGEKFQNIRNNIIQSDLSRHCSTCENNIRNKNFLNALSRAYDNTYKTSEFPVMMELELDNTCNLECVMCNGRLSSSIRKNREKKPVIESPYNEKFINELNGFIPFLEEIRINGGEPFLSNNFYRIIENILKIKPGLKVIIATNGTILNEKVKSTLNKGKFHINLSIDSLKKETYEKIRVNAVFENMMGNFQYFYDYCKAKGSSICILTNPMRNNWREMPDFIEFCNDHNIPVWFNTIQKPKELALWTLNHNELKNIYQVLSEFSFNGNPLKPESFHNAKVYRNLVHGQIKTWMNEAENISDDFYNLSEMNDPEQLFYKLLIKQCDINETRINEIKLKLDQVLKEYRSEIDRKNFFRLLGDVPPEIFIHELETKPVSELVKLIAKIDI
jgi:radical SAM protein with 4Fe4S-binding SPASM domain